MGVHIVEKLYDDDKHDSGDFIGCEVCMIFLSRLENGY
jgi:hypothetical protein